MRLTDRTTGPRGEDSFFASRAPDQLHVASRPSTQGDHVKPRVVGGTPSVSHDVTLTIEPTGVHLAIVRDSNGSRLLAGGTEADAERAARRYVQREKPDGGEGSRDWPVTRKRLTPRHVAA